MFLVVDDSKLARLSTIKSLTAHLPQAQIIQAENGEEAILAVQTNPIKLVFLDLTMPIMSGYEAIPKILQINSQIAVVVVSADIQEKAQQRVLELGARMHVQKPINSQKMAEILELIAL